MARCSTALPPDLPPRAYQPTSLCCASSSLRVGLLSGSCPSARGFPIAFLHAAGRPPALGLWWWFLHFHVWYFHRGLEPRLQRAHAGHTQGGVDQPPTAPESK